MRRLNRIGLSPGKASAGASLIDSRTDPAASPSSRWLRRFEVRGPLSTTRVSVRLGERAQLVDELTTFEHSRKLTNETTVLSNSIPRSMSSFTLEVKL